MKNAFYFTLKALLVLKTFKFLSWLFGYVGKRFDQKDQVISKYMTLQQAIPNTYLSISQEVKAIRQ